MWFSLCLFVILLRSVSCVFTIKIGLDWIGFKFGTQLPLGKPSGSANNFPQLGRCLGHVTLKFLANDPQYLENYLGYRLQIWSVASYVECRLDAYGCINNLTK